MDLMLGDSWLLGHHEVSLWAWTTRRREQWREEGLGTSVVPSKPNAHSQVISGPSMSKASTTTPSQRKMIWMAGKTPRGLE